MSNNSVFCLGLDVSSKTIGVTVMDITGHLKNIFHISLPKSSKKNGEVDIYDKIVYFRDIIKEQVQKNYNIKHIYIEEPLKSAPNINTAMFLAKFNGMVTQELFNIFSVKPQHYSVYECRKAFFPEYVKVGKKKGVLVETLSLPTNQDKKVLVLNKVNSIAPYINWVRDKNLLLKEESYDMADSFVVATAGLILNEFITKI